MQFFRQTQFSDSARRARHGSLVPDLCQAHGPLVPVKGQGLGVLDKSAGASYSYTPLVERSTSLVRCDRYSLLVPYARKNLKMRLQHKLGPLKVLNQHLNTYPTPINLSYAYNFGSLAGIVLASQIVTGILLAMHYVGHVDLAFNSVVHLMNDVPSGMILRYAHANGASLFFIVVYIHILRGVYYSSGNQPREAVWITGVVILLVMVITAFIGYTYNSQKWNFNDAFILYEIISNLFENIKIPTLEYNKDKLYGSPVYNCLKWAICFVTPPITLNSKGHIPIDITPESSYYNLHLVETQLQIQKETKQKAGVYMVVNNINRNFYVGSAISNRINTRFRSHCINLTGSNKPLTRAIRKYGIQNFSFHIIENFKGFVNKENLKDNHLKLLERETFFINSLKPIYNILIIAGSSLGLKHTKEARDKMRLNYSEERKNRIGNLNKGKSLSTEVKNKLKQKAYERYANKDFKEQFLHRYKDTLFKSKPVILCNFFGDIISKYTSITQVSQTFSCDRKTVSKYLNSGKLFKKAGFLKSDDLNLKV